MGQLDGFVVDNHTETAANTAADFVLVANPEFVYQSGIGEDVYQIDDSNRDGWIALYVITAVVAVLANLLFLLATWAKPGKAKVKAKSSHWLLVSLSLRDLLMVAFCLPLTLLPELVYGTWPWTSDLCLAYTAVYQCLVILLPLTLLFLSWHLFAENLKWKKQMEKNAADESEIKGSKLQLFYLPLIWLLALLFALPTAWHAGVVDQHDTDFNGNKIFIKANNSKICKYPSINAPLDLDDGINDDMIPLGATLATFWLPMALMVVPWFGLLVQASGLFNQRQLKTRAFRMSLVVVLMVVVYEGCHVWLATYDLHSLLTTSVGVVTHHPFLLRPFLRFGQSWLVVMKWSIFLPSALNPLLYLLFSAGEVQAGLHALCRKICPCFKNRKNRRNDSETTKNLLPPETETDPQKKLSVILNKSLNDSALNDRFSIES